eukprot:TRINITY_DN2013_c1_g1_i1.p1 TRINITY_DN2013_c1_g1~~TRINITY_DN2013_c1_g1_i1.p1  ORF type:complete len:1035 (+),score=134.35 TRINITY_DN2013_c1_g1_i1:113-3217(+)
MPPAGGGAEEEEPLSPGSPGWVPHRAAEIDEAELRHRRGGSKQDLTGSPTGVRGQQVADMQRKLGLIDDAEYERHQRSRSPVPSPAAPAPAPAPGPKLGRRRSRPLPPKGRAPPPAEATPSAAAPSDLLPPAPPSRRPSESAAAPAPPPTDPAPPVATPPPPAPLRPDTPPSVSLPPPPPARPAAPPRSPAPARPRQPLCSGDSPWCRPCRLLAIGMVISGLIVAIVALSVPGDGEPAAPPTPAPTPAPVPPVYTAALRVTVSGAPKRAVVTAADLRNPGAVLRISMEGAQSPAGFPSSAAEAARALRIVSNVSSSAAPGGVLARCGGGSRCAEGGGQLLRVESSEPSLLVLQLGPDSGFETYWRERLSISVDGVAGNGFPVILHVAPDTAKIEDSGPGGSKVASAAAVVSGAAAVGSAAGAGQLARLSAITAAFDCPGDGLAEVDWQTHPLLLLSFPEEISGPRGPSGIKSHASAALGNMLVICAFSVLLCLAGGTVRVTAKRGHVSWESLDKGTRVGPRGPREWLPAMAVAGFPSRVAPVVAFVAPGVGLSGATLAVNADSAAWKILGAVIFTVVVLGGSLFVFAVIRRGTVLGMDCVDAGRSGCRGFLLGYSDWECEQDATFVARYALWFEDYRPGRRWFLAVELLLSGFMGVVDAIRPGSVAGCRARTWVLLAVGGGYLGGCAILRPHLAPIEFVYTLIMAVLNEVTLAFIVANQYQSAREHWTRDAAGVVATVTAEMVKVKLVIDLVVFIIEVRDWCQERTEAEEEAQASKPPPDPPPPRPAPSSDRSALLSAPTPPRRGSGPCMPRPCTGPAQAPPMPRRASAQPSPCTPAHTASAQRAPAQPAALGVRSAPRRGDWVFSREGGARGPPPRGRGAPWQPLPRSPQLGGCSPQLAGAMVASAQDPGEVQGDQLPMLRTPWQCTYPRVALREPRAAPAPPTPSSGPEQRAVPVGPRTPPDEWIAGAAVSLLPTSAAAAQVGSFRSNYTAPAAAPAGPTLTPLHPRSATPPGIDPYAAGSQSPTSGFIHYR